MAYHAGSGCGLLYRCAEWLQRTAAADRWQLMLCGEQKELRARVVSHRGRRSEQVFRKLVSDGCGLFENGVAYRGVA